MGVRSTNSTQSFFDDFFRSGTDAVKESLPLINSPITATGGDSTLTITGYKVHIFTTTGASTFVVSSGNGEVEYLVVAGGGSGSAQYGGGGGAGGLRTNLSGHPLAGDPVKVQPGNTTVVVGAGGAYVTPSAMPGVAGGNSYIDPNSPETNTITATGGGGGGHPGQEPSPWYPTPGTNGGPGGSGGGGAGRTGTYAPNYTGGAGNAGGFPTPTREGYPGGVGTFPGNRCGGGGGGAGAAGSDAGGDAGPGGVGVQCLIAGNPSPIGTPGPSGDGWFAGGGGGGGYNVTAGSGGAGGGGAGRSSPTAGVPGTPATGGGGGGGFHPGATTGGNGGSGIVVIRYPTS